MPSKNYEDNWERVNKWLNENAPEYVLKLLYEWREISDQQSKTLRILKDDAQKRLLELEQEKPDRTLH